MVPDIAMGFNHQKVVNPLGYIRQFCQFKEEVRDDLSESKLYAI